MTLNSRITKKIISIFMIAIMTVTFCIGMEVDSYAFSTFTGKSPFSGVGYKKYYHNKDKFNGYKIKNGIDISAWQDASKCDYKKAKKDGVDFAIIRVTWTGYGEKKHSYKNPDKWWKTHFKKARAAGLDIGLYCFSQAKTEKEAKNEANYICDQFEKEIKANYSGVKATKALKLPIYMDYEFAGGSSGRLYGIKKTTATKCAKKFCETIKSRGYKPGIYANLTFLNNTIDAKTLGKSYDIWAAQYYKKNEFTGSYSKWQYSSAAKIDGIKNEDGNKCNVDVNFWYVKDKNSSSDSEKEASSEPEKEKPVITPTTIEKVTGGKKQFKVTWVKQSKSKIDGYQIQYSRDSSFSNGMDEKKKVTSYKTTSKTYKTNFRKENYYVRIRTYKKVDGKTYYSKWSSKKKVYVK